MTEKQIASSLVDSDITCREKAIELKNVAVHYNESKSLFKKETYTALKDISFDVYKGETLGIIGRNGAGKSTLLRLLAGIIKPDQGEVLHHCKSVSLMALAAGFDPNLSGRQNAVISGMLIGHSKKEMLLKLNEIKEFSELGSFFDKPVKNYSSGMKARLGFATAMNTHPDVLLIDEVLAVGDANFKQKAEKAITEKIASDITVILVSHSEQQMKRLCDRVVWIEQGYVECESGNINEVFSLYKLNLKFSDFGIVVRHFNILIDNIFFTLDQFKVHHDNLVEFTCVVLRLDNEKIECLKTEPINAIFSEPTETPGLKVMYKDYIYSSHGRYHGGYATFNEKNQVLMNINGIDVPIAEFEIKRFEK